MSGHEPLVGVGKTALGVALVRARESRRPDRLFDDPYAAAFVTASPGAFAQVSTTTGEPGEPEAGVGAAFALRAIHLAAPGIASFDGHGQPGTELPRG